jgi:hypothetical protein
MKRKTFNQHIFERDIAWQKSASSIIFADNIESMKIPFSTPIYRRTFGKVPRTTVFHIANPETFRKLIKIEGKKKSISAMTYADPYYILNGINQLGGIAVEMEADVLVAQSTDIMSIPDKTGRRWVSFKDLTGIIEDNNSKNAAKLNNSMEKDIETLLAALATKHVDNPAIPKPDKVIIKKKLAGRKYADAWYYMNPDYLEVTNPAAKKKMKKFQHLLVKDYLDGMESVMKKNAKELGKAISAYLLARNTMINGWDELVVNKFKITKVHLVKSSIADYFGANIFDAGFENTEYDAFIKLVKGYGMQMHDTSDTISTHMNDTTQDLLEDDSVARLTKGKKRRWVNAPTSVLGKDNDVTKDIYDIITKTYASIGGYVDFSKPGDLPSDFTDWIINDIDDDPEVDAVRFAKKGPGGMKFAGSATDGTAAAKKIMLNKTAKMLKQKGNYGEVSDAIAHVLLTRYDIPVVSDEEQVKKLLPGKKIKWIGENPNGKYPGVNGWYERVLTGAGKHMKIMVGVPKKL